MSTARALRSSGFRARLARAVQLQGGTCATKDCLGLPERVVRTAYYVDRAFCLACFERRAFGKADRTKTSWRDAGARAAREVRAGLRAPTTTAPAPIESTRTRRATRTRSIGGRRHFYVPGEERAHFALFDGEGRQVSKWVIEREDVDDLAARLEAPASVRVEWMAWGIEPWAWTRTEDAAIAREVRAKWPGLGD